MESHSFGHSVFGRLPRDFWRILLGSSENGRDPKLRREHCFVNEKVFKNIRKTMTLCTFFSLGIGITKAPFTRYRFHFISDWFHIGLAFCLHDTVFISYRIGLLFTRERTNPICFIPFSRFQMKTLWKWHETNPISCKRSNPVSTQYGTSLSILQASHSLGELRRMCSRR